MSTLAANSLLFFDQTAVTVALPALQREFRANSAELQWTITAYLLALATFMVVAGRLADRAGRRRMLLIGIGLFGVASAACAAAPSLRALIAARFVQGLGGSLMQPLALGNTTRAVGEEQRGWAVGLLSTGGTTFLTIGPLVSGAIVGFASWRWLFLITLPLVAFSFYQAYRWVTPSRDPLPWPVQVVSLAMLVAGVAAVVIGVSELAEWGRTAAVVLAGGVVLLGVFARYELRSDHPLVPLALLRRDRLLLSSLAALFAIQFAVLGTTVYLVLFLEHGMGESAFTTGILIALSGVFTPLLSLTTGRMTDQRGPRTLVAGGLVLATAGLLWVGFAAPLQSALAFIPGLLLFSLSRPAVFTPASTGPFLTASPKRRALTGGLITESRQMGSVLGVAVLGAVFAGVRGTDLSRSASVAYGFEMAMLTAAAVTAAAAVVVFLFMPRESGS